jgi:pilus assembly protein CpaB
MRLRSVLLMFVAIALAGGTAMLARSWLAAQRSAEVAEAAPLSLPAPAKSVLVARAGIQRGQILKPEDLVWQPWPEGGLDRNYILLGNRTVESFAGWVARNPIRTGEPVTEAKILPPSNRGFLAAVLRPGMRAISVPVTVISGISGFVFPGDQVDLLLTYPLPSTAASTSNPAYEHKIAQTLLRDIRVIAIDQHLDTKAGEAVVARTATLEVSLKQSEIIALASEIGKLSLSLRSLAPGPADATAAAESPRPGQPAPPTPESTAGAIAATYTLDSEISSLLPRQHTRNDNTDASFVTILRGGRKAGDSPPSQPAPRGS